MPPEQYSNSKNKSKEIGEEIKSLSEHESAILFFDDILGTSNNNYLDQFFIGGRRIKLDNYYLSQSYIDLPKRKIRNNCNKIILRNRTLKDMEIIYRNVDEYDVSYDEFKQLCRKTWEEEYDYLCIDRSK